jgi:hypothetical protein
MTAQLGRLGAAALATVLVAASTARAETYYVAPTGNDKAAGTLAAPFKTIGQATSVAKAGDTILVGAGTYRETVRFAASGLPNAPIKLEPAAGETVTVSGADLVEGWQPISSSVSRTAMGPSLGRGNDQVFVDHVMAPELAFPHQGSNPSSPSFSTVTSAETATVTTQGITTHQVTLRDPSLTQPDHYWQGALVHVHRCAQPSTRWIALTATIEDSGAGWISFAYELPSGDDGQGPVSAGNLYYITSKTSGIEQGTFTALGAANEWARDGATGELELVLADPASHVVEVKHRTLAFDLSGTSNIEIHGIGIFAAGIATDGASKNDLLDSLTVTYVSHFTAINQGPTVTGWTAHVADTGIVLQGEGNTLQGSTIAFSAGNGVTLGGTSQTVQGCVIHDVDYAATDCAAVYTSGSGHQIVHDTLFNAGRCLVVHRGTANLKIELCELHHAGLQMTDLGATYTYDTDGAGTEIAYNWIHDVDAAEPENASAGIVLDSGTQNVLVHHNVIWNAPAGIKLDAGKAGTAGSGSFRVFNNTIYDTPNKSVLSTIAGSFLASPIENNIFWNAADTAPGLGYADNLESTNPGYVDAATGNFQLLASSTANTGGISIAGITDAASPSLGAYQSGAAPWIPGAPVAPAPVAPAPVTPAPAPAPAPDVTTILPSEDAPAILNAAKANQQFRLVPGARYTFPSVQVSPPVSGWSLDATGATITWTIVKAADSPQACFRLATPGAKVVGGTWTTNAVFVEMFNAATVQGVTLTDNATQAVKIDEQFANKGAGGVVTGCTFGLTNSVTVYVTQPCTVSDNTFAGSYGEVSFRADSTNGNVSPNDVLFVGNSVHSAGTNGKGCAELRQLGTGCQFTGNTLFDYVRVGQGSATSKTQSVGGLIMKGNRWSNLPVAATNTTYEKDEIDLLLMSGITVVVEDNDFLVDAKTEVASHGAESMLTFTGNRRHLSAPGIKPWPDLYDPNTIPATCTLVDGGGNVVLPFGQ